MARDEQGRLRLFGWFVPAKLFSAPLNPEMYAKLLAFGMCLSIVFLLFKGVTSLFPKKRQVTSSTTIGTVESGANLQITTINQQSEKLKQGLYLGIASDRGGVGVFREVNSHLDVEIGGGMVYKESKGFVEVRARVKF